MVTPYVHAALGLGLREMAAILSLRLLPFVVCVLAGARGDRRRKAAWAGAYAAVVALTWHLGASLSLLLIAAAASYYLVVSLAVPTLARWVATRHVTRAAAFVLLAFVCLALPGVVLGEVAVGGFLVVGWDVTLSAYSYVAESAAPGARPPSTGDALFFVLVNPTLVYSVRGRRVSSGGGVAGLLRAAAGCALLFVNVTIWTPVVEFLRHLSTAAPSHAAALALGVAFGAARFVELYTAQSALASLLIGLMRQVGWDVPECYRYPAASSSPIDFWRRWNVYVHTWLEAYVFLPVARRLARRTRRRWAPAAIAAALTLAASGALHVALPFAGRRSFAGLSLAPFIAAGALVVVWSFASTLGRAARARLVDRGAAWLDRGGWILGRAGTVAALVAAAIVWG